MTEKTQNTERDEARRADEAAARQVQQHHAAMVAELDQLSAAVRDAAPGDRAQARDHVATWFETVLVPHADEEEATTYAVAGTLPEGRLLIDAMAREHVFIKRLVALFAESDDAAAGAYARAVYEAFEHHQDLENDLILPLLLSAPDVSLVAALGAAHDHQTGGHGHDHH
jgi:hypothetical protein